MNTNSVREYLANTAPDAVSTPFLAYLASLETVKNTAPQISAAIVQELKDQRENLKLIASENYCSMATQLAMGNLLTDKYAEGFPFHRFYAGCDNVDAVEALAVEKARKIFGVEHAYVQPHSGADANLIAYWAILSTRVEEPCLEDFGETNPAKLNDQQWAELRAKLGNQRLLGLDYYSGGHLTHGYRHNVSAQMFDAHTYTVNRETGLIDYDELEAQAKALKPLIFLAGYSAYPRKINFRRMREIADSVNAVFMVDMAHFAGLVAGGVFKGDYSPVPHAHVVTTTTHKTLRGPRGGMVLSTAEFAEAINKGCPLVIGGPLPHVMAAKAVALEEASQPGFADYAEKIVANAEYFAQACIKKGMTVATGGTDNHLFLIDVRSFDLTGRQAESVLRECGITMNRNSLPFDPNGPWYTSGLRVGTPAVTTLGMGFEQMDQIADLIYDVLSHTKATVISKGKNAGKQSKAKYAVSGETIAKTRAAVKQLLSEYVLYPELDLALMQKHFL